MDKLTKELLEIEKQKWLAMSFEDLKQLDESHRPYHYTICKDGKEYRIQILLLESNEEYLHPSITIDESKPKSTTHRIYDWIVYRDNTKDI
jgi:hypothetical protein